VGPALNLLFDIETDGLYDDVSQVHCIGILDLDTKETYVFNDEGTEQPISKGVQMLEDALVLIGHNIIGYDLCVLRKLYPWFTPNATLVDTLILSRIYHADMLRLDQRKNWSQMPSQLYGRHSLESYGYRLGEYKGNFGKTTDWKEWSEEMQQYMVQDLIVTHKLWKHFLPYLNSSN